MALLPTYTRAARGQTFPCSGAFAPATAGTSLIIANTDITAVNDSAADIELDNLSNDGNIRPIAVPNGYMFASLHQIVGEGASLSASGEVVVLGRVPVARNDAAQEWGLFDSSDEVWVPLLTSAGTSIVTWTVAVGVSDGNAKISLPINVHLAGCNEIMVMVTSTLGVAGQIGVRFIA